MGARSGVWEGYPSHRAGVLGLGLLPRIKMNFSPEMAFLCIPSGILSVSSPEKNVKFSALSADLVNVDRVFTISQITSSELWAGNLFTAL